MNILSKNIKLDFSKEVINISKLLELNGKIKLVGSMNIKNILYPNDYDFYEVIHNENMTTIYNKWVSNIKQLLKNNDVYIGDIKCGIDKNNNALRWKISDIFDGKLKQEGTEYNVLDCMKSGEMWKFDLIVYFNSIYKEMSCVYELKTKPKDTKNSIKEDAQELYKKGDYYKYIKRVFSFVLIEKNEKLINKILPFLNSDIGLINNVLHDLKTIEFIINNFSNLSYERINNEIDNFKNRLSTVLNYDFLRKQKAIVDLINKIKKSDKIEDVYKLIQILQNIINTKSKQFLNKNKDLMIF